MALKQYEFEFCGFWFCVMTLLITRSGGLFSRLGEIFKRAYYLADIREGTLVGTDRFGNQYYQAQDQKKTQWGALESWAC